MDAPKELTVLIYISCDTAMYYNSMHIDNWHETVVIVQKEHI